MHVNVDVCVCVRAYLLCRAECCGQRKAGVPACPGSLGHHCPPPDSENGSESTPQLYGKARHSQTPRCHAQTHTEEKKGRRDFQYGSYYDKLLLNSIPDGGIKKIGNARHKTDSKHFQVKHFFCFVLLSLQSDQAK